MRLSVATLADYAAVRAGSLTIVSAGVNFFPRPSFPAPMVSYLALLLEVDPGTPSISTKVAISISLDGGDEIGRIDGEIEGVAEEGSVSFAANVPLVFSLRSLVIPAEGDYIVKVGLSGIDDVSLRFYARVDSDSSDDSGE